MGSCSARCCTKKVTLRHVAFGLTIYSAVFNAVALLVLSCTTPSDLPYLVILMFRVPCAAFLLTHGCFFALGIWLFISANRKLTALERVAVAVTCLSGAAEIYFFASFFLTSIPAISGQSALVPIMVWASAVGLIAWCANRKRRSAATASREAPAYFRTLGLITYPLYLTHNVIGTAIIRVLVNAGLDATSAVWVAAGHACPGLLVYLHEDRASHPRCDDANHCVFRTASGETASFKAPAVFPGAGPSAAHAGKDDRRVAIAGALPDQSGMRSRWILIALWVVVGA